MKYKNSGGIDKIHKLEIEDVHLWFPPLWTEGPFFLLLTYNFKEAFEIITRLVDFATRRWIEYINKEAKKQKNIFFTGDNPFLIAKREQWYRPPENTSIILDGVEKNFLGDERVYVWSAGLTNPPYPVEVALMALEQYLYVKINKGESVNNDLRLVLRYSQSTAFLKVLVDVGKRKPELFLDPLLPILGSPEVFRWDLEELVQGRDHHKIGLIGKGEWFHNISTEFHSMKHRKLDLRVLVQRMLLTQFQSELGTYFSNTLERWEEQMEGIEDEEDKSFLEQLIITFDLKNYEVKEHPENGKMFFNKKLAEQQAQQSDQLEMVSNAQTLLYFPIHCREILDGEKSLKPEQLEEFWSIIQKVDELKKDQQLSRKLMDSAENALFGGIAVLFCRFKDWLNAHDDHKKWCLQKVINVLENPPARQELDSPEGGLEWGWDCFVAEIVPTIWVENPNDKGTRALVANLVFSYHYKAIVRLFNNSAANREQLNKHFQQLRRLLFEWAFVVMRIRIAQGHALFMENPKGAEKFNQLINEWVNEKIEMFIQGKTPSVIINWEKMNDLKRFKWIDKKMKWCPEPLDVDLVLAAHSWYPGPDKIKPGIEKDDWLKFWNQALAHILKRVHQAEIREREYLKEDAAPKQDSSLFVQIQQHLKSKKGKVGGRRNLGDNLPSELKKKLNRVANRPEPPHLYKSDGAILKQIAVLIQFLDPEDHPELYWRKILSLPVLSHHWIERFLSDYHAYTLTTGTVPPHYVDTLHAMFEFLENRIRGDMAKHSWHLNELWNSLLGLDSMFSSFWNEKHLPIVKQEKDLFRRWIEMAPKHSRWSLNYLYFLKTPAAEPIMTNAISWLEKAYHDGKTNEYNFSEKDTENALARVLMQIWMKHPSQLTQNGEEFDAYKKLLSGLVKNQNEIALDLSSKIGKI